MVEPGDSPPTIDDVDGLVGAARRAELARERAEQARAHAEARHLAAERRLAETVADAKRLKELVRRRKGELDDSRRRLREAGRVATDLRRLGASPVWRAAARLVAAAAGLAARGGGSASPGAALDELASRLEAAARDAGADDPEAPSPPPEVAWAGGPEDAPPAGLEAGTTRRGPTPHLLGDPTVVIPVFGQLTHVQVCLDSVLAHTCDTVPVMVIDDASPDARIGPWLRGLAERHPRLEVVSNPRNLGYTATVNRGCRRAPGDVVLLNSDTQVTPGWLEGLCRVAHSRPRVATVTPLSNAAGAFSVPERGVNAPLAPGVDAAAMAALVARLSPRRRPQAPTGHGFCLWVRREALDAVGLFDAESFPRGYGEENDFCMRARAAGMVNLIDDATFVAHAGGASFGEARPQLLREAKQRLARLHPTYRGLVEEWMRDDGLSELRADLARALDRGPDEVHAQLAQRPTVLFVLHAGEGGSRLTTADLAGSLADRYRCLLLECGARAWRLRDAGRPGPPLEAIQFPGPWVAHEPIDADRLGALRELCARHHVGVVHVRALLGTGPEILTALRDDGTPTVLSLHDFYTVCPTIHLLDHDGRYCAGRCTPGAGDCRTPSRWLSGLPELKHRYVHDWRARMAEHLPAAGASVVASHSALAVLEDHFPHLGEGRTQVIPHGRDLGAHRPVGVPPGEGPVRVAVIGAGSAPKGLGVVAELAAIDAAGPRRFEWHLLGPKPGRLGAARPSVVEHGPYSREELPELLGAIAPSVAMVPSRWPETWSHTLTEAWMAGLPTFAGPLGAPAERIREAGGGWIVDLSDLAGCHSTMLTVTRDPAEWWRRRAEIEAMAPRTVDDMARDYDRLYRRLLAREPAAAGVA